MFFFALIRISVYRAGQNNLHNPSEHWQNVSKKAHAQLRNTQLTKTHFMGHMEELRLLQIDLEG